MISSQVQAGTADPYADDQPTRDKYERIAARTQCHMPTTRQPRQGLRAPNPLEHPVPLHIASQQLRLTAVQGQPTPVVHQIPIATRIHCHQLRIGFE